MSIKSGLAKTSLYMPLLKLRSIFFFYFIKYIPRHSGSHQTVYCVSPYKTGTTYFSGLFDCRAYHEPLMYTTITNIGDLQFLKKRKEFLNLELECSGFFAHRLTTLREFAPDAKVIYLSRNPEKWIGSVINYFSKLEDKLSYNYVARLIFDDICRYPVERFYSLDQCKKNEIVKSLLEYWIDVYSAALNDEHCLVLDLESIDDKNREIEAFTGLKIVKMNVWKRENPNKLPFNLSEFVDLNVYRQTVAEIGYVL